jgi:DNA-directed RNA polymerase specialized sigma24 family protein
VYGRKYKRKCCGVDMCAADKTKENCALLLLRAQKGDSHAVSEASVELKPGSSDVIASRDGLMGRHECEDVAQEVLLVLWKSLSAYRGESSGATYILAIPKRIALKAIAKRRRGPTISVYSVNRPIETRGCGQLIDTSDVERRDAEVMVRCAMARIGDAQRQAVESTVAQIPRREASASAVPRLLQVADRIYQARKRPGLMLERLLVFLRDRAMLDCMLQWGGAKPQLVR